MLQDLINQYLANDLADFAGLQITGRVPVKTELINAVIADFLQPTTSPAASSPASAPATAAPTLNRAALEPLLKKMVKRAEVKATDGAIVLEFEVGR